MNINERLYKMLDDLPFFRPDVNEPKFEEAGRVHDWRNYVPRGLKETWSLLSEESRLVIMIMAGEMADREEWE